MEKNSQITEKKKNSFVIDISEIDDEDLESMNESEKVFEKMNDEQKKKLYLKISKSRAQVPCICPLCGMSLDNITIINHLKKCVEDYERSFFFYLFKK
jgi:hypothetical protein